MYIKSLSRKIDVKGNTSKIEKSDGNVPTICSPNTSPKAKTADNYFPFLSLRKYNNMSLTSASGFPVISTKNTSLRDNSMSATAKIQMNDDDFTFETFDNDNKRNSWNKDLINDMSSTSKKAFRKTLSSLSKSPIKFKKSFQYTCVNTFKPVGASNFAINIQKYAQSDLEDDLLEPSVEKTNRKNIQQFKQRKLLLSSLLTPEMTPLPKKANPNVEKIFQNIDQEYRFE